MDIRQMLARYDLEVLDYLKIELKNNIFFIARNLRIFFFVYIYRYIYNLSFYLLSYPSTYHLSLYITW